MGGRFLVVVACALVCGAASPAPLTGTSVAQAPQLLVKGATATGASGETTIAVRGAMENAASAVLSIYVPGGYSANLTHPAGTQIGTVASRAQVLESSSDAVVDGTGTVLVADKAGPVLQAAATRCTGTPTHAAIWNLHLVSSGQVLDLPAFVDAATGAETTFSSAKLVLCLPQPYAKKLPNYSPSGTKIVDIKAVLSAGVLTNPRSAGAYLWRSVITPWDVSGTTPNPAAAVETQSVVTIPSSLSLKGKVRTIRRTRHGRTTVRNSVLLSGKLLENLHGVGGAKISIFAGSKSAGSVTTGAGGTFARAIGLRTRMAFRATATVPARATPCVSPLPMTSAGCVAATLAGYKVGSNTVAAAPRQR